MLLVGQMKMINYLYEREHVILQTGSDFNEKKTIRTYGSSRI